MKKLVINYLFNASFQLLNVLLPFITTPYIARVLGPENLGAHAYSFSIIQVLVIIGMLGIPIYGNRQIAMASVDGKEKLSIEFWSIYILQITVMMIIMIFYVSYSFTLNDFWTKVFLLQGIHLFASLLDISWFLLGLQKIKQTVLRNLVVKLLSLVSIFLFVKDVNDLDIYIFIISGSTLIGQFILWSYVKKFIKLKPILEWNVVKVHIKPVLILLLPQLFGQIYLSIDKIILNHYSTIIQVGYYDQAMKIIKLSTTIITSLGVVVLPSIAKEFAAGNKERITSYVKYIFKYILFISIPMVFGLSAISNNFVSWFLGKEYIEVATILKIISPVILFIGLGSLFGVQILAAVDQSNKLTLSIFCGAIVSLIISLCFVPKYGMYATAAATLLTEITVAAIQLYFVKEYINLRGIYKSLMLYIASGLIMVGIIHLLKLVNITPVFDTFLQIIIGIIIYIIVLVILREDFILHLKLHFITFLNSRFNIKRGLD